MVDLVLQGTTLGHLPEPDWNSMVHGGGYRAKPQNQVPGLGQTLVDGVKSLWGTSDIAQSVFEKNADKLQCSINDAQEATREMRGAAIEGSSAASQMSDAASSGQTAANAMNTASYSSLQTAQHLKTTFGQTTVALNEATSKVERTVGYASATIDKSAETIRQAGEQTAETLHSASTDAQQAADDLKGASGKFEEASKKAEESGQKFEDASQKAEDAGKNFEEWNQYFEEWSNTFHAHYDGSWAQNRVTDLTGDANHVWNSAQQVVTGECNEGCSTAESFLNPYPRAYAAFKLANPLNYSWTTWGIVGGAIGMYAIYATFFKKSVSVSQKVEVNVYNSNGNVKVDSTEKGYNQSAKVNVDSGYNDGISHADVRNIVERELARQSRTEARLIGDRFTKKADASA